MGRSGIDGVRARVVTASDEAHVRKPLKEIADGLDPEVFWQVHRGTVVRASEITRAVRAEMFQRPPQRRQLHQVAFARQFPVEQERVNETGRVFQFRQFGLGQLLLACSYGKPVFRRPCGILDQTRERQLSADLSTQRQCLTPT